MKNKLSTKAVAVLLAAVLLLSSGILSVLPGINFGSLLEIKASAEDPKNKILLDTDNGLFFTIEKGATIVGTDPDLLSAGLNGSKTFTLPNEVTDSETGKSYMVFEVAHFAFLNSGSIIEKIVIPDNFRELTLARSSFAGMKTLKEFEMDSANAVITGPLFELVTEYEFEKPDDVDEESSVLTGDDLAEIVTYALGTGSNFNGSLADLTDNQRDTLDEYCKAHDLDFNKDKNTISVKFTIIGNCFPKRNDAGELEISAGTKTILVPDTDADPVTASDGTTLIIPSVEVEVPAEFAPVRFFGVNGNMPVDDRKADREYEFSGNMNQLTSINLTSKIDFNNWNFEAYIFEKDIDTDSIYDDETNEHIGTYELKTETSTKTVDGKTYTITTYDYNEVPKGAVCFKFYEVDTIGPDNIVDGNGAYDTTNTVVIFKSPVSTITLGSNVKRIPNYMFYDTDVDREGIESAIKNATSIGKYAFVDCNVADSLDLSGITDIGEYAFAACDGINEVTIPEGTTSIGAGAFSLCDNLSTVRFNATNCEIAGNPAPFSDSTVDTIVFGKDVNIVPSNVAADIPTLRNVIFLADSLTVEDNAFNGSNSISNIETKEEKTLEGAEIGSGNDVLYYPDITVSKHVHDFQPKEYPSTCTAEGYTADTCICGDIDTEKEGTDNGKYNVQPKLNHEWDPEKTEKTKKSCLTDGYDIVVCKNCGYRDKQNIIPKDDHKFTILVGTGKATCDEGAYEEYQCELCKQETEKKYTSEKLGHNWADENTVTPGCETEGYTIQKCTREGCTATQKVNIKPAAGHSWSSWTNNNNASYSSDATRTRTCSVCGKSETEAIAGTKLNDSLKDIVLYFGSGEEVEYGQEVIVVAKTNEALPKGFKLVICEGNNTLGETNESILKVSVGKVKNDRHFTAKIIDESGNVTTNSRNITFLKTLDVKAKTGFFNKLIAIIKSLFRLLPVKEIGANSKAI